VLYERVSGQLAQEKRDLEARKSAPARKSDAEIEAEITLEALKEHLAGHLRREGHDPPREDGEARAEGRGGEVREVRRGAHRQGERRAVGSAAGEGTRLQAIDVWQSFPELKDASHRGAGARGLTTSELMPVVNSLYFKSKDNPAEVLANTQYIYDRLKAATGSPLAARSQRHWIDEGQREVGTRPGPERHPGKDCLAREGQDHRCR
jgi:hypothetical protein